MRQINLDFVSPVLGVYVNDFDIRADQLESSAQKIRQWLDQYLVVVVRGQSLEATEQRDLVAHFGPLFYHHADEGVIHAQGLPEVLEMRKEADGARLFGGSDWHADVTFRKPSASCRSLAIGPTRLPTAGKPSWPWRRSPTTSC